MVPIPFAPSDPVSCRHQPRKDSKSHNIMAFSPVGKSPNRMVSWPVSPGGEGDMSPQNLLRVQTATSRKKSIGDGLGRISTSIFPPDESTPDRSTIILALLCFACYIILCALAVRFPSEMMRLLFICYGVTAFLALLGRTLVDFATSGKERKYSRNTGNTVLTVLLTIVILTVLFAKEWYPALTASTLRLESNNIRQVRIPAVSIIQDSMQQSEAFLVEPSGCWIGINGGHGMPLCESMTMDDISQLGPGGCDCGTYFKLPINPAWNGSETKRAASFTPNEKLVISDPSMAFNFQVNFTYNTSQPGTASVGSPSLWILISDPAIDPVDAVNRGMSSLTPFNANGATNIMLSLNHFDVNELPPHYSYSPMISTLPNLNLACDVARDANVAPCQATLQLRFPSLQLTSYIEAPSMRWTDVAGTAASYFALAQFASWAFSGLAWTA